MKTQPNDSQNPAPPIFKKQLEASKHITGDANTFVPPNPDQLMQVVPLPSIALQWLINSNGWPLGRMTACTGEPRTFKTTFSYQLAAWFLGHRGFAQILDSTGKLPVRLLPDMIADDDLFREYAESARLQGSRIRTRDEWKAILEKADELRKESYPKPQEMDFPWLSILDLVTEPDHELQLPADQLPGWPATIHTVYRASDDQENIPILNSTTLDLHFSHGGTSSYNTAGYKPGAGKKGKIITMQVRHSNLGPTDRTRKISVPVLENYRTDETSKKSKNLYFDWGAADAHFLMQHEKMIKDTMDIHRKNVRGHGDYYWSEATGIPEDKSMPAKMFGMVCQSNEEIMASLRNDLYVQEYLTLPRQER